MTVTAERLVRVGGVRPGPRLRFLAVVLGVVVGGAAVLGGVVSAVSHVSGFRAVSDLAQLGAASAAAVECARAARRSTGTMRTAWWSLTASTGAWAAAQTVWCGYELVWRRAAPFPSIADVGFLASVLFALIGLCCFIRTPARWFSRALAVVEAAIIASGLLLVSWMFVLGDVYRTSSGSVLERTTSLAYPVGDCILLAVVLFATTRRNVSQLPTLGMLGGGFACVALADSSFAILTQSSSYSTGHVVDLGWVLGFAMIAVAARHHRSDAPQGPFTLSRWRRMLVAFPFVPLWIGGVVAVIDLSRGTVDETAIRIAFVAVCLLCLHQLAVVSENDVLTSDLESRVRERTEELEVRERQFAGLVEHSSDVTFVLSTSGVVAYASSSARGVLGLEPSDLVGTAFESLLEPGERTRALTAIASADRLTRVPERIEVVAVGSGTAHPIELTITNLLDEPALRGIVVNCRDVTERRGLEDRLRHEALHDTLTGLANRRLLCDHIQLALDRRPPAEGSWTSAVLVIDLDDFKAINDGFGHQAGDDYLVSVAERLRRCVRPGDTVARLGGDEFAVLLADVDPSAVTGAANRMVEVLQLPIRMGNLDVAAPASIGVRVVRRGDTPQLLLRDADIALYAAKSNGKRRVEVFDLEMGERATRRLTLEADLREAWWRGEISVLFQPIVELPSGRLRGAEALVRWTHPRFGTVSPVEFIPLAEATGAIVTLGLEVMAEACRRAVTWAGHDSFSYISVNVSPVQLAAEGFLEAVDDVLASTGLPPECLLLEVTEGVLLTNFDAAITLLERLRGRGIRTAIDDFGTGYSSLAYAQHLPVDLVKIDRAFTVEATGSSSVIPAIMEIARVLDASVVAEGIETDVQAAALLDLGCRLGQGYLFSPPVPAPSFERFVESGLVVPVGATRAPSAPRTH